MKIAVLLDNTFTNDRRVYREAVTLAEAGYEVVLFAVAGDPLPSEEIIAGIKVKRIFPGEIYDVKKRKLLYSFVKPVMAENPDVIHCHDQLMLHLGALIKKENPALFLVYDSHELFHEWPLNINIRLSPVLWFKSHIVRKIQVFLEKKNAKYIDFLITVNDSLAINLKQYFKFNSEVFIVRNTPEKQDFEKNDVLRTTFDISAEKKILVFIGASIHENSLNLEQIIDEFGNHPAYIFIMISGEGSGKKAIMEYVRVRKFSNILFHERLTPEMIGHYLASADVGLVPTWNKSDLSYWYALDNKLFEYLMSEIPILATRQPEYVRIVEDYKIGLCIDPDTKGAYLKGFEEIISNQKAYCGHLKAAKEILNWENEKSVLLKLYSGVKNTVQVK